jgi:hypothetical protein
MAGRRSRPLLVLIPALMVVLLAPMAPAEARSVPSEGVPAFGHVFVIIGENITYSHLKESNSPYLLTELKPDSAWLSNYYAATHWSQANYVAMVTGQFTKCEQQDYGAACHQNVENLFHQLDLVGASWKVWLEEEVGKCGNDPVRDPQAGFATVVPTASCIPSGPCQLTGYYATGNPPILFDNIEGAGGVWSETDRSRECLRNDIPAGRRMHAFNERLARGNIARFNMILPDSCDSGNGNCAPIHNRIAQYDAFLAREVPKIEASPAFGPNDVIMVTYDEDLRAGGVAKKAGLGQGGHVAFAVVGPRVVPGVYRGRYYHYSFLRTMEDGFGLSGYLGHAVEVNPINSIWRH